MGCLLCLLSGFRGAGTLHFTLFLLLKMIAMRSFFHFLHRHCRFFCLNFSPCSSSLCLGFQSLTKACFRCNQPRRQATVAKVTKYTMKELQQSIRALEQLKNCDFCLCFLYAYDLAHRLPGLPVFSHDSSYHKHRLITSINYC